MDRARWLRDANQGVAARSLMANRPALSARPHDAEKWFENKLLLARASAADRNWMQAYQIASKVDDAYEPGTRIMDRSRASATIIPASPGSLARSPSSS
jgi:soluble lytic murein transglycosylase